MATAQQLWAETFNIGYEVRKNNQDGLEAWQPLKKKYANFTETFAMNPEIQIIAQTHYKVGSDSIDHIDAKFELESTTLNNEIEAEHFFIQHFRIPILCDYKLPLLKLMQIAYNAGQFRACVEKQMYEKSVVNFYSENKLSEFETFVNV